MKEKIKQAQAIIDLVVAHYKKPVVLCSFGKDSLAMLHIAREMGHKFPVIFYREPFFPEKYAFANSVILNWGLNVYDYPPTAMGFMVNGEAAHAICYHQAGEKQIARGVGLYPFKEGEEFLCAKDDLINRPRVGQVEFPWDICLNGHKSADVDPVMGSISFSTDILAAGDVHYAYPLRQWTDNDVLNYCEQKRLPMNGWRYIRKGSGWESSPDMKRNSDYFPACYRCIDRREAKTVHCPKQKCEVSNISDSIHYDELKLEYMNQSKT